MNVEDWKYDAFVKANGGKFSVLDFVHAVFAKVSLPQDFTLCMGRFFAPRMIMLDGIIVASDWFDGERYKEYRNSGMSPRQAQPWINMVEITDIFRGISFDNAKDLAALIAGLWDSRIIQNFPDEEARATVILENDAGEVFVTIGEYVKA
ncbi:MULTISPECIES: hypothetical protein [Burkholderia]|uniref:hypothetical protein n=1 Tax=Burkholderia TaxID=32008 RepID=UPI000AE7052B|nr:MULTISPECIES: hypothetical protein [Burkholderia]QRR15451.1 hypothetical protein GJG85_18690 [Burkholderia sp. MS389]QVN15916.1 hypothetical protein JYG37_29450 [Burkholderia sp. LAS2]